MYEIFLFLKQAGIIIHFLSLLIITQLSLWKRERKTESVGHVLFELVKLSAGVEIYAWLKMEQDIISFKLQQLL